MYKISVQTSEILDRMSVEDGFRLLADAGFDAVDFNMNMFLPGKQIGVREIAGPYTLSEEEFLQTLIPYKKAAAKYGIAFGQAHAPYPSWTIDSEPMNSLLMRSFELCLAGCAFLDCPYLVIHPVCMGYDKRLDTQFEWDKNIERYSALIPAAKRTGTKICLENMFTAYHGRPVETACSDFQTANKYADTLNEMAGEELFGFCYDCGHAALLGKDQRLAITTLGRRIFALHLHDNDGMDDKHRFPYYCAVDWDAVCKGLAEIGYSGSISFETAGELRVHEERLKPYLLKLLCETGRMFAEKIEKLR